MGTSHTYDPRTSVRDLLETEPETAAIRKGKRVKVKKHHAAANEGDHGTVTSVHANGAFYGIAVGGGTCYVRAENVEDADDAGAGGDGDGDGDADDPGGAVAPA